MKSKLRGLSKSELPVIRHRLGLTIKSMAQAVGLKLPSYYYYETRYVGEELPAWLSDKILAIARKKNIDLTTRALRAPEGLRMRAGGQDQGCCATSCAPCTTSASSCASAAPQRCSSSRTSGVRMADGAP
jgi:hypothetical protein